ncbi:MAG: DUF5683 domain-containing protein [Ginsengibacter sp.]
MTVRSIIVITLFLLFVLPGTNALAQQKSDSLVSDKEDTLIIKSNVPDTSGKSLLALDTATRKKKFNPKVATLRSAILPGWGQWYNKKYWKIPIVYGALGITAGVFFYNLKTYKQLRQAVIYRLDSDTTNDQLINPEFVNLSTESIKMYRGVFRQNVDYSVLVFMVFWGLNVVDATVDAHLKAFNVSPDITMKIRPSFNYLGGGSGVSLVFSLRDKHDKPFRPLP